MGGKGDLSSIVGITSHRAKVRGWASFVKSSRGFQARESVVSDLPLRRIPLTAVRKVVWGGETERGVVSFRI